ncbi:aminoglycoside phosphotransferase (APT) family kinase protein [Peribacillus frigoritolerans]|uniref:phosphotransferase n=1 Tax=Peribacillus frigoritolerans TaxID=450367 RepID=UPI00119C755E|nr:phosphotransferase [Peribacillus frigoritolerans]TWD95904.1 aminoglycoside phosphotransferase (APT) family kinase protein [Peribacillus frigoritolerans]
MNKPWLAEYPVSLELAGNLIMLQFPEIELEEIKQLGEGFDNTVIQINGQFVFRFPRRPIAVTLIQVENQLLPSIAGTFPLAIPEPIFFGKPSTLYPYPFTGYKMVKGHLPVEGTKAKKVESAKRFARFLKVLHSFPVEKAKRLGVQPDGMMRLDIPYRKKSLMENVSNLIKLGYFEQAHAVKDFVETLGEGELDVQHPISLVHGDIHIRNVLLDDEGVLAGVIDWGDVHIGNPAIDFSFLYSYFPKEVRSTFFEIYGEIEKETESLARFRAIYMLVTLLVYGIDRHDEELIAITSTGLKFAIEE